MKEERKEKETALTTSVGADVQQSPKISNTNIISENADTGGKTFPVGKNLNVISMTALFDQVYNPKLPLIEGLLYQGMYLFAGAPKIGKSFFMAQLSYSIAKGITLWQYPVRQGTVLYPKQYRPPLIPDIMDNPVTDESVIERQMERVRNLQPTIPTINYTPGS